MRLAPTLLLPALAGAVVQASHLVPSRPLQRGLLDDLLNICATIPDLDINLLGIDIDLNLCLCLQGLDIYLATHDDVNLQNQQIADVNAKINGLGVGYSRPPPNAMRVCDGSSGFTCVDGFVPCNGACVAANTCPGPSSLPRAVKRDTKITTLHHARAHCGSRDAAVCGVANPKHEYDFECVDIRSDFDSCGGCVIQHPFPSLESKSARGQECAAIRNARSVSCQNSKCVVQKCRRGYKINANGNGCELKQGKAPRGLLDSVLGSAPTSTTSPSNDINILGLLTIQLAIKLGSGNGPVCHDGLIGTVNQLLNPLLGGKDLIGGDAAVINLGGLPSGLDVDKLVGSGGSPLAGLVDGLVDLLNSLLDGLLGSCGAPLLNDVKAILDQLVGGLQSCGCGPAVAQAIPGLIANASSAATASPPGLPPAPPLPSTPAPSNDIDILGLLTIQLAIKLGSGNGPVCHDGLIGTVNQLLNPLLGGKDLIGGDAAVINLGNGLGATSGGLPLVGSLVEGPVTDLVGGLIGGLRRRDSLNGLLDGLLGSCGAPLLDDVEAILNQLLGGMKDCGCGPAVAQAIPGLIADATSAATAKSPVLPSAPPLPSTTSPSNDIHLLGLLTIQLAIKLGSGNGTGPVCHDGLIGTVNQLLNPLLGGKDLIGGNAAVIDLGGGLPSGLDVDKLVGGSGGSPLAGLVDGLVDLLNSLLDGLLGSCGKPLLDDVKVILDQLVGGLDSCGCGPAVAQAIPGLIANATSAAKRAHVVPSRRGHSGL